MKSTLPFGLATALVFLLAGCQFFSQKQDIRKFYFPVESLHAGLVYEYQSLSGDISEREYWYLKSFETDSGSFLVTTFYDRYFRINQILREKIVSNGSIAKSLLLYETDFNEGIQFKIETKIEAGNLFPFEVGDSSGVFLFSLNYRMPNDSAAKIYLIRNRRFGGVAPDFTFKNKKIPAVSFTLQEVLGSESEGTAEGQATGQEWYAEGLGLVQFIKNLGKGSHAMTREFRLVDTYPMSELEERAKALLLPKTK